MMSQRSKREPLVAIQPRYLKARRQGKTQILDEFIAATGSPLFRYPGQISPCWVPPAGETSFQ